MACLVCTGFIAAPASTALATERQLFVGGTVGYGFIDQYAVRYDGVALIGELRYGLNDAIDLEVDVSGFEYPGGDQLVAGASVGGIYVFDVMKIIPQVGVTFGFADIITYACPEGAHPCGHDPYPALSIPAAFDYRLTPHLSFGAHFRYSFFLAGDIPTQLSIGAALAFSTDPK